MKPKPIIIISYPVLFTESQYKRLSEVVANNLQGSGWSCLILDGCGEHKVSAFGLNDELMEDFVKLKKLVYENIKAR